MGLHGLEGLKVRDEFEAAGGPCFENGGNLASSSTEPATASVRGSGGEEVLPFHQVKQRGLPICIFFFFLQVWGGKRRTHEFNHIQLMVA